MKETERSEKQQNNSWNADRPSGRPPIIDQERSTDIRGVGDRSLRTRYNQEAITQPLRRPSDDDILPPGRR